MQEQHRPALPRLQVERVDPAGLRVPGPGELRWSVRGGEQPLQLHGQGQVAAHPELAVEERPHAGGPFRHDVGERLGVDADQRVAFVGAALGERRVAVVEPDGPHPAPPCIEDDGAVDVFVDAADPSDLFGQRVVERLRSHADNITARPTLLPQASRC